ncbi:MAG: hypothetical protein QMD99_13835 [Rhizobiaceae bacterium]|nr:hypothetical protein [Rhizobiaceae bacterium]
MPIVRMPDGTQVSFPDDMPKEKIRSLIASKFPDATGGAPKSERLSEMNPSDKAKADRENYYSSGIYAGQYNPLGPIAKTIDAFAHGAQRAPMFGWDDEAQAALSTIGGGDYTKNREKFDAQKQAERSQNPVASGLGELSGGLATGGTLAKAGVTMAGRNLPVIGRAGGAALEGGGYGMLFGAGEAKPGERMAGAGYGAAIGAGTGLVASKVGDALASKFARKASQQAAPSVDDISAASNALYTQADQAGVVIKPQTTDRLIGNMAFAAGKPNTNLRPRTAGVMQDIVGLRGKPLTLKDFDELRQSVGLAMKNADPQDVRTLTRMKDVIDGFADNVAAGDITGNVDGFKMLKDARSLWAKKSKTELIEQMMDLSDVQSSSYSQSGMQNAIKQKAKQLYGQIAKGKVKGFTAEETAVIRKLSKGEMTPKVIELLGKFAPRGVISFGTGVGLGTALGGPVGAVLPGMIGYGAANMADRAALQGVQALRNAAATGNAPVLQAITNKTVPIIGGLSGATSSQLLRSRAN